MPGRADAVPSVGRAWGVVLTLAAAPATAAAQYGAVVHDFQALPDLNVAVSITPRVDVLGEAAGQVRHNVHRLDVFYRRGGVSYRVSDAVSVSLNYAHETAYARTGPNSQEHRFFQQLSVRALRIGAATVGLRTRTEQRRFEGSHDVGGRVREQVRVQAPLGGTRLGAVASVEPFFALNTTDWGSRAGFERNYAFAGVAGRITRRLGVEAGYLNEYVRGHGRPDRMNHIFPVIVNVRR